jgi:hypothetical protein
VGILGTRIHPKSILMVINFTKCYKFSLRTVSLGEMRAVKLEGMVVGMKFDAD